VSLVVFCVYKHYDFFPIYVIVSANKDVFYKMINNIDECIS